MSLREEGNTFFRQGRWAKAAELYERAVREEPGDGKAWSNLAQAQLNQQDFPAAAAAARRAHALDPAAPKPLYRLAMAQRGAGCLTDALATLSRAPPNAEVLALKCEIEREQAELEKLQSGLGRRGVREGLRRTSAAVEVEERARAERERQVKEAEDRERRERESERARLAAQREARLDSFAALKAAKAAKRSYADGAPGMVPVSTTRGAQQAQPAQQARQDPKPTPTTPPDSLPAAPPPKALAPEPSPASAQPARVPASLPPPPADPTSLAPGTGLGLLRTLAPLSPEQSFTYLRSYPASVLPKLFENLLDPDSLHVLLTALDAGRQTNNDGWIAQVLDGLRANRRWKMTALMLPKADREALARLAQ